MEVLNVNIGVMGHVDSGKTSLVKAMSTTLSTAALDKHPQSQERGMTIDLGFSSLKAKVPQALKDECQKLDLNDEELQLTLVDCPGHASLIRTIIGGAQIIDTLLLVVDCLKGMQAQTAECLVVGEITTERMVIALNKIDLIPETEREARCAAMEAKLRKQLHLSKFRDTFLIVRTAASPGGEKTAAQPRTSANSVNALGISELVSALAKIDHIPHRETSAPFYFAIDHCFPIKGQGTVTTGTCLRGSAAVGSSVELPALGLEKKIKSIQKFRKAAKKIVAGDRAGICLAQLDASLVERGVLAAPGSVPMIWAAVAHIRKVRFFKEACRSESKVHVTIGHTTCVATVFFFGGSNRQASPPPAATFKPGQQFPYQEEILPGVFPGNELEPDECLEQYVLLRFEDVKVRCQTDAMVIGSRLAESTESGGCRLVFYGRLIYHVEARDKKQQLADIVQLYKIKQKTCSVLKIESPSTEKPGYHYEALASGLFSSNAPMQQFIGLKVQANTGEIGAIASAYGAKDKFKVSFKAGSLVRPGPDALYLRFKRYIFRPSKSMYQDDDCFFKEPLIKPEDVAPLVQTKKSKKSSTKSDKKNKTESKAAIPLKQEDSEVKLPAPPLQPLRKGRLARVKGDPLENGRAVTVIAEDFFTPEEDQRSYAGATVRGDNGDTGTLVGPFGKAGKSKVDFSDSGGTSLQIGAPLELRLLDDDTQQEISTDS